MKLNAGSSRRFCFERASGLLFKIVMSPRLSILIILLLLVHIVFTGCGASSEDTPESAAASKSAGPSQTIHNDVPTDTIPAPPNTPTATWFPQQVSLTCGLASCPVQVGALLFLSQLTATKSNIMRCTAFLIDQDKIMTNGHCDFLESSEGFFFTRTDAPERTVRRLSRRLHKEYTAGPDKKRSSSRPDYAIFQLETPIKNIQPLQLARGNGKAYEELKAFVVNEVPGQSSTTLAIGQLSCVAHRNERFFPFEFSEKPDVLTLFDCNAKEGNSGSPMFAPGSWEVEAVLEARVDTEEFTKRVRKEAKREAYTHEVRPAVVASNVRCLNYPAAVSDCLKVSDELMRDRFVKTTTAAVSATENRVPPGGPYQTEFRALLFDLNDSKDGELIYFPQCRTAANITNLTIPSERITLQYDEWGKPTIERLSSALSTGTILRQDSSAVQVKMNWSKPFAEYAKPEEDLRKKFGQTFSIALPFCTR